jgi:hypothetical protein
MASSKHWSIKIEAFPSPLIPEPELSFYQTLWLSSFFFISPLGTHVVVCIYLEVSK